MEVKLSYKTKANCHAHDLWRAFRRIEDWRYHSEVFGDAGWVHGEPWAAGSRFFLELNFPKRVDLEVTVAKFEPQQGEIVMLSHGGGVAGQQWLRFRPINEHQTMIETDEAVVGAEIIDKREDVERRMYQFFERWFEGLKLEAEKHCFAL